ncbi:MAG: histidine kinase [Sulfurimonas sp.]|nr:MAG: histidine kinase [Sulfurimonas sp.]
MVTTNDITTYIAQIPPAPEVLKQTLVFINQGELSKAAKCAEADKALHVYLKTLVNKPVYGFKNEVSELSQIFGILGTSGAQQVLYNYMLTLLSPDKWELFKLNESLFFELQAQLNHQWKRILRHCNIDNKDIESAITLLPASIIVCEALFKSHRDEVMLLRSVKAIDYNTILRRLSGMDLFDICQIIAKKWEMPQTITAIVQSASGRTSDDVTIDRLGRWMHLLLFYEFSQAAYMEAGLNDFLEFHIDYAEPVYEEFMSLMEIQ